MKLFEQLVKTVVEIVKLPVAVFEDVIDPQDEESHTAEQVEKIKEASSE